MSARCVLFFARTPELEGKAKGLYAERAVFELARRRVARAAAELGAALVVSGGAPAPEGALRLPQRGRTFGERLEDALDGARALGFAHVVVVPCDVPALSLDHLVAAFDALEDGAVPLGPSPDGGVYLIGVDTRRHTSFSNVRWRTPAVLGDLVALAARHGGAACVLAPLRDVDGRRDLAALAKERLDAALRALIRSLLLRAPVRPFPARRAASGPATGQASSRAPPSAIAA